MTHEEFRRVIYPHEYKAKSGRIVVVREEKPDIEIKTYEFNISKRRDEAYDALVGMGFFTVSFNK